MKKKIFNCIPGVSCTVVFSLACGITTVVFGRFVFSFGLDWLLKFILVLCRCIWKLGSFFRLFIEFICVDLK